MSSKSVSAVIAAVLAAATLVPRSANAAWPNQPAINLPVCRAAGFQTGAVVVSDGSGGAIIAWQDLRNGSNYDIYAQHVLAAGTVDPAWPIDGRALCLAALNQNIPMIISDGAGGAIVTWMDTRAGASSADIYAQHVLASGALDPAWPPDGRGVCTAVSSQQNPMIASDGAGGALITWLDYRGGATADIYAQHVLASGAVDPGWPLDGRVLCAATNDQTGPVIVADGAGGAIVAWHDFRGGATFDIYAQHVLASGAADPLWPPDGRALCIAISDQLNPAIITDGAGGAIVTWRDVRTGANDIYAQHVFASGGVDAAWPPDGRGVCTATNSQIAPTIAADGSGGAIISWQDFRSGASYDIYAQHVLSSGAVDPAWPVDGRILCAATGNQQTPTIIADSGAGAIVTWFDFRAGTAADIYAQHVLASGAVDPGWPSDGRAVCTAAGNQQLPTLIGDGAGGAIVTWFDARSGVNDIYAQRVARFGYLGTPEPVIASVGDVPNDQGGKVKLSWDASWLDTDASQVVDHYWIFRSVPGSVAETRLRAGAGLNSWPCTPGLEAGALFTTASGANTIYWEFLASQPAYHIVSGYSFLAATTGDSIGAYNPVSQFMVTAWNAAGTQYWSSAPASGYSVDNLPPAPPAPFTANYTGGSTFLHWNRNAESDFANYRLYRGAGSEFVPGPGNLIASPPDTGYADAGAAGSYYKLSAVDAHGNESGYALVSPGSTTGVDGGAGELALALPWPNPARGATTFALTLPAEAPVRLAIYDTAGRRARQLLAGVQAPGTRTLVWDGRDDAGHELRGGLYFLKLEAAGRVLVRRLARLE